MLRYAVEGSLHPIDALERLCKPRLDPGAQDNIDGGSPRGKGSGGRWQKLNRHIGG